MSTWETGRHPDERETKSLPANISNTLNAFLTYFSMAVAGLAYATSQPPRTDQIQSGETTIVKTLPPEDPVLVELRQWARTIGAGQLQAPMLKQGLPSAEACQLTSAWFKDAGPELQVAWNYLVAHKKRWSEEMQRSMKDASAELKKMRGPVRWWFSVPSTPEALEKTIGGKLKSGEEFNCGTVLSYLAKDGVRKAQEIGVQFIGAAGWFIMEDLKSKDTARKDEAARVAAALNRALGKAAPAGPAKGK